MLSYMGWFDVCGGCSVVTDGLPSLSSQSLHPVNRWFDMCGGCGVVTDGLPSLSLQSLHPVNRWFDVCVYVGWML